MTGIGNGSDQASDRGLGRIALAVALTFVAAFHILGWAQHPPDVDPINFMAALRDYDISRDTPHPPGYPLYVGLGRLAQMLIGPAHAFQLVNLAMVLATAWLLAFIGGQLGSRHGGRIAAILFATHPLVWAGTVIQECYVSDAFAGSALVACGLCFRRWQGRALALFFGIELAVGLLRPTSCVLLLPVALTAIWLATADQRAADRRNRLRWLVLAICAAGLALAIAYTATIMLAGGMDIYRTATDRVMGDAFRANSILGGAPLHAHIAMVAKLAFWFAVWSAPLAGLVILGLIRQRLPATRLTLTRVPATRLGEHDQEAARWQPVALLLLAWIAPALGFYAAIYYLKPTYQILFVPGLSLGCGWALARLAQGGRRQTGRMLAGLIMAGMVAGGMGFFWLGNDRLPEPLFRLTHAYFSQRDQEWTQLATAVAATPGGCVILHPDWSDLPAPALRLLTPDQSYAVRDDQGVAHVNAAGLWSHGPLPCLRSLPRR